jgi:hypothetical protein
METDKTVQSLRIVAGGTEKQVEIRNERASGNSRLQAARLIFSITCSEKISTTKLKQNLFRENNNRAVSEVQF